MPTSSAQAGCASRFGCFFEGAVCLSVCLSVCLCVFSCWKTDQMWGQHESCGLTEKLRELCCFCLAATATFCFWPFVQSASKFNLLLPFKMDATPVRLAGTPSRHVPEGRSLTLTLQKSQLVSQFGAFGSWRFLRPPGRNLVKNLWLFLSAAKCDMQRQASNLAFAALKQRKGTRKMRWLLLCLDLSSST